MRIVSLGMGIGKLVKREVVVKLVVDALIATVNGPEKFACLRTNARGILDIHLAETELELNESPRIKV